MASSSARKAAVTAVASAAGVAALIGVVGALGASNASYGYGYGYGYYGCPGTSSYGYAYGYGYGYSPATATPTGTATATATASGTATATTTATATSTTTATATSSSSSSNPLGGVESSASGIAATASSIVASIVPHAAPAATTLASASPSATSTSCPTPTAMATATGSATAAPTTTKPSATTPPPTFISPAPLPPVNPATGLQITLSISKVFVTLGTHVQISGHVTRYGVAVPGVSVDVTETYLDGKLVPLGAFTTDINGNFTHDDRPLYIGTIHASAYGVSANNVPSRVILTYRSAKAAVSGSSVKVTASTHPGFLTGTGRQERVQLLLTDSHGRQQKVLGLVNAAQRSSAPGEGQGINNITFKPVALSPGTHYVVVKVLGTPVNTGAPSKPIKVVIK